jgi:hypothetical protein
MALDGRLTLGAAYYVPSAIDSARSGPAMSGDEDRNPLNVIQLPRELPEEDGQCGDRRPWQDPADEEAEWGIDLRTITTVDRAYRHREVAT